MSSRVSMYRTIDNINEEVKYLRFKDSIAGGPIYLGVGSSIDVSLDLSPSAQSRVTTILQSDSGVDVVIYYRVKADKGTTLTRYIPKVVSTGIIAVWDEVRAKNVDRVRFVITNSGTTGTYVYYYVAWA